jgi:hypothetical protein
VKSGTVLLRIEAIPEVMYCSLQEMSTKGRATLIRPTTANTPSQGRISFQLLGKVFWLHRINQQPQGAEQGAETDQDERADLGDGDLDP